MEGAAPPPPKAPRAAWPPALRLWKSRLPLIVVPVLSGLRQLSWRRGLVHALHGKDWLSAFELAVVVAVAACTGYARLPFSMTWWLLLLAAFALETPLLLGVATVLSLSVLLGWYGVRLCHPHAVSALWGGSHGGQREPDGYARAAWQTWDLFVHGLPAVLVLYWHGPSVGLGGVRAGTVTLQAALAALPLNLLWLWGLGSGLPPRSEASRPRGPRLWPWGGVCLADTNVVYRVAPQLPGRAWWWMYGSHWAACALWAAALALPPEALFVHAVFAAFGLISQPYTTAWWALFLVAVLGGGSRPLLQGMVAVCAATTSMGFYGARVLAPYAFKSLVRAWVLDPVERFAPAWCSAGLLRTADTSAFMAAARLGDLFLHLIPTSIAVWLFWADVTGEAALAALPANLAYFLATGSSSLADTNRVYGVKPPLPPYVWRLVYGSHWVVCGAVWLGHLAADAASGLGSP